MIPVLIFTVATFYIVCWITLSVALGTLLAAWLRERRQR